MYFTLRVELNHYLNWPLNLSEVPKNQNGSMEFGTGLRLRIESKSILWLGAVNCRETGSETRGAFKIFLETYVTSVHCVAVLPSSFLY